MSVDCAKSLGLEFGGDIVRRAWGLDLVGTYLQEDSDPNVAVVGVAGKYRGRSPEKFYGVAQSRVYLPRVGIFAPQFQITGYISTLLYFFFHPGG